MSNFLGEYLYIVQPREEVLGHNNIYKFGRTSQQRNKRMEAYPKNSRCWMTIIMQNTKHHEAQLNKLFRSKYKQHKDDRGDEYYEVDDIQEMMKELWDYHQQHFRNIFNPSKFNGDYYMMLRKDDIVKIVDDKAVIKRNDWNCCGEFGVYLMSHGWLYDTSNSLMIMDKDKYIEFIENVNKAVGDIGDENEDEDPNNPINPTETDLIDDMTDNLTETDNPTADTSRTQQMLPTSTDTVNKPSTIPALAPQSPATTTISPHIIKQLIIDETNKDNRTIKQVAPSFEQYIRLLSPYLKKNKLTAKDASAELIVSPVGCNPHELKIMNVKLYNNKELFVEYNDFSELNVAVLKSDDPNRLRMTKRKESVFIQIYDKSINEYLLSIPTFEFKKGRGKRGKCDYVEFEFDTIN